LFAGMDKVGVSRLVESVQVYSLKDTVMFQHPGVLFGNERAYQVRGESFVVLGADDESDVMEQARNDRFLIVAVAVQHGGRLQAVLVVVDQVAERGCVSRSRQKFQRLLCTFLCKVFGALPMLLAAGAVFAIGATGRSATFGRLQA